MVYVVMGVSGCGKSTVARLLADRLDVPYYDGDDFHPTANVNKMGNGIPLNDDDRLPWLRTLAAHIHDWAYTGEAVLACSALKRQYRNILRRGAPGKVQFIWLDARPETFAARMGARTGHFMPSSLLTSQLETLEPPTSALRVCLDEMPEPVSEQVVKSVLSHLNERICLCT